MEKGFDNIRPPKIEGEKKELLEDSQEFMWGQLDELKQKLYEENNIIKKSPSFSYEEIKNVVDRGGGFNPGYQTLRETASWYEMSEEDFLKKTEEKSVLDIGSSNSVFAKQVREKNGCEIVSLDIKEDVLKNKKPAVVAKGEALPFRDGIFDEIFATFSLPYCAMEEKQVENFFKEALRVVKIGGHINIAPITTIQNRALGMTNMYISNLIQIKTINVLQELLSNGNVEIILSRNYMSAPEKYKKKLKEYAPTLAIIKKLK